MVVMDWSRGIGSRSTRWRGTALAGVILATCIASALLGGLGGGAARAALSANLAVTKTDSPDPVAKGGTLTYTIVVRNLGPGSATSTSVEDKLPGGLSFVSAAATGGGSCSIQGKTVTCDLGTIAPSAQETVTIKTKVTKASGSIDNTASAKSTTLDPVGANNSDTERTTIGAAAGPSCGGKSATIVGTTGPDTLVGTGHRDVIVALAGNDRVYARGGGDIVCAGPGRDLVKGGAQGDVVSGGGKRDRLFGGGGPDLLRGNAGNDLLVGNAGRDRLLGGTGRDALRGLGGRPDRCYGGPGPDLRRAPGCEIRRSIP
jgi:uncharacterized repeat protein (TIGR01451 family)